MESNVLNANTDARIVQAQLNASNAMKVFIYQEKIVFIVKMVARVVKMEPTNAQNALTDFMNLQEMETQLIVQYAHQIVKCAVYPNLVTFYAIHATMVIILKTRFVNVVLLHAKHAPQKKFANHALKVIYLETIHHAIHFVHLHVQLVKTMRIAALLVMMVSF